MRGDRPLDWGGYGRAPMNPGDLQRLCAKVALFDWSMGLRGESIRNGDESLALFGSSVAAKLPAHSDGRRKGRRRYGYRRFPSLTSALLPLRGAKQ